MFDAPLAEGRRGAGQSSAGLVDVTVHDLRDFTTDRHRVVDDVPYGGGPGHGAEARAAVRARWSTSARRAGEPGAVVLTSPQGRRLTQAEAARLAGSSTS